MSVYNNMASKYIKQKLLKLQEEMNTFKIIGKI